MQTRAGGRPCQRAAHLHQQSRPRRQSAYPRSWPRRSSSRLLGARDTSEVRARYTSEVRMRYERGTKEVEVGSISNGEGMRRVRGRSEVGPTFDVLAAHRRRCSSGSTPRGADACGPFRMGETRTSTVKQRAVKQRARGRPRQHSHQRERRDQGSVATAGSVAIKAASSDRRDSTDRRGWRHCGLTCRPHQTTGHCSHRRSGREGRGQI